MSSPSCNSIPIPANDNGIPQTCVPSTRSSPTFATLDCNLNANGYREQLNLLSSFIDGTQIYGSNKTRGDQLRTSAYGLLRTSPGLTSRKYMPLTYANGLSDSCSTVTNRKCFVAGESRPSENLGLSGIHTLFMREHNRIASQLALVNPRWSDNKLYNEVRRLLLGIYQHIVYSQWIPAVMGRNPNYPDLVPKPLNTYWTGYDPKVFK